MASSDAPSSKRVPFLDAFEPTSREAWEERIRDDLGGRDYEQTLLWHPEPELSVRPYYRREDAPEPPGPLVTNGEHSTTLRATLTAPSLVAANEQAKEAVAGGADALHVTIKRNGTSWSGLPLFTPSDMQTLLQGISLEECSLHVHAVDDNGRAARALFDVLLEEASRRDTSADALRGTLCFDPWAAALTLGHLHVDSALNELAHLVRTTAKQTPEFRTVGIDARVYHEGGATTSSQLAYTLAAISETFAHLSERGVDLASASRHLHITIPVGTSYFLEIAKLRALRHLIPQVIGAFLDVEAEVPEPLIQAITSRRTQTRYDAHMNMVRGATAAAAAVVGGADVLEIRPFDDPNGEASAFGERIARNTALILHYESRLDHVADPAAGAYYIEALTEKLAERAWTAFQKIEEDGGLLASLQAGTVQHRIREDRQHLLNELFRRERVLVGINHYPDPSERLGDLDAASPAVEIPESETTFRDFVTGGTDEQPVEIAAIDRRRLAEPFESLRIDTEHHIRKTGHTPAVFLLPLGPPPIRSMRATFARNVLGCAGFNLIEPVGFDTLEEGLEALTQEVPDMVVLCTSDEKIPAYARELVTRFAGEENAPLLVIAGRPEKEQRKALLEQGVDAFIHQGINLLETLRTFQIAFGIETSRPNGVEASHEDKG